MEFREPSEEGVRGIVTFIGIGSNIGDSEVQCRDAIRCIGAIPETRFLRNSSFYRTEPVGFRDQDWFVNAVAEIRTGLRPRKLLDILKRIEREMGRTDGARWGPRMIDLDILLYGQEVVEEEGLVIPHPELHRRRFVLEPLCELASYVIHPAFGVSAHGLLDRLTDNNLVERCAAEVRGE